MNATLDLPFGQVLKNYCQISLIGREGHDTEISGGLSLRLRVMNVKIKKTLQSLMVAAAAVAAPVMGNAKEITLIFENQDITMVGEFAGFTQGAYIIISNDQTLHVPAVLVRCEGDDCFEIASAQASKN
jgi:hypothetical protein